MYANIHETFIKEPLLTIFTEGVEASCAISDGIDNYPLKEYFLQSLFIRMSGAQEQKLSCLLWSMATFDLEFRRKFLHGNKISVSTASGKNIIFKHLLRECSRYLPENKGRALVDLIWSMVSIPAEHMGEYSKILNSERNNLLNKKIKEMRKASSSSSVSSAQIALTPGEDIKAEAISKRKLIFGKVVDRYIALASSSVFFKWCERESSSFVKKARSYFSVNRCPFDKLVSDAMDSDYEKIVYKYRNSCAHNTFSCQPNLPTLSDLASNEYSRYNFFFRSLILIITDVALISIYDVYCKLRSTMTL